jgi:uncharacterized protein with GYD domain
MSQYIALLKFTQKGAENIKDSPDRAHRFNAMAKKAGVKVDAQFWTMGAYDGVLILRAETEQKVLHMLTLLAAEGNVRTKTMQAFTDKEFTAIVS